MLIGIAGDTRPGWIIGFGLECLLRRGLSVFAECDDTGLGPDAVSFTPMGLNYRLAVDHLFTGL